MFRNLGVWVLIGAAACVVAGGCDPSTRYRVLSTVFDNVPPPGSTPAPRRPVRLRRQIARNAKPKPTPGATPTPAPEGPPIERVTDWEQALKLLPKDAADNPDWTAALDKGVIDPRSALDPTQNEPPAPLPLDVELVPEGNAEMKVVFPHAAHTQWLQCPNCHPDIFQMQKGADKITMADVFAGQFCGKCHGKVAFDVATACPRCHVQMGGGQ